MDLRERGFEGLPSRPWEASDHERGERSTRTVRREGELDGERKGELNYWWRLAREGSEEKQTDSRGREEGGGAMVQKRTEKSEAAAKGKREVEQTTASAKSIRQREPQLRMAP
jgi:hypothetical protein